MKDQYFSIGASLLATRENGLAKYLNAGMEDFADGFFFHLVEVLAEKSIGEKIKRAISAPVLAYRDSVVSEDVTEKVIEDINESLGKTLASLEKPVVQKINALVGFAVNNKIYLSQAGKVPGYFFRKSKISSLTESAADEALINPSQIFSDIICGELIFGDRIVLGNSELFNRLSLDRIRKITEAPSLSLITKEMLAILRRLKIPDANAILLSSIDTGESSGVYYIDEKKESFGDFIVKNLVPAAKKLMHFLAILAKGTYKYSKIAAHKTSETYKTRIAPKAKATLSKSGLKKTALFGKLHSSIFNMKANKKQTPQVKIKARLYNRKSKIDLTLLKTIFGKILHFLRVRENRKYIYLGLIVLLLLFGYLKIRYNNSHRTELKKEAEGVQSYDQAKGLLNQYMEDIALGRNIDKNKLYEALVLAQKGEKSASAKDRATELTRQIQTELDKLTKTTRIYPENGLTFNTDAVRAVTAGNEIYVFGQDGIVYLLDTSDNEIRLVASLDKDLANKIRDLTYVPDDNKIYLIFPDKKFMAFAIKDRTFSDLSLMEAGSGKFSAISAFSSALYLLDTDLGQIFKYIKTNGEYGNSSPYIPDPKKAAMGGAVSMAIDGSVWVLASDGQLIKFSRGQKENDFKISGLPEPYNKIEEPIRVYTGSDSTYIYILDRRVNRIIRLNKNGQFEKEYILDVKQIKDFVVNEKLKKLWLISENQAYETDL